MKELNRRMSGSKSMNGELGGVSLSHAIGAFLLTAAAGTGLSTAANMTGEVMLGGERSELEAFEQDQQAAQSASDEESVPLLITPADFHREIDNCTGHPAGVEICLEAKYSPLWMELHFGGSFCSLPNALEICSRVFEPGRVKEGYVATPNSVVRFGNAVLLAAAAAATAGIEQLTGHDFEHERQSHGGGRSFESQEEEVDLLSAMGALSPFGTDASIVADHHHEGADVIIHNQVHRIDAGGGDAPVSPPQTVAPPPTIITPDKEVHGDPSQEQPQVTIPHGDDGHGDHGHVQGRLRARNAGSWNGPAPTATAGWADRFFDIQEEFESHRLNVNTGSPRTTQHLYSLDDEDELVRVSRQRNELVNEVLNIQRLKAAGVRVTDVLEIGKLPDGSYGYRMPNYITRVDFSEFLDDVADLADHPSLLRIQPSRIAASIGRLSSDLALGNVEVQDFHVWLDDDGGGVIGEPQLVNQHDTMIETTHVVEMRPHGGPLMRFDMGSGRAPDGEHSQDLFQMIMNP